MDTQFITFGSIYILPPLPEEKNLLVLSWNWTQVPLASQATVLTTRPFRLGWAWHNINISFGNPAGGRRRLRRVQGWRRHDRRRPPQVPHGRQEGRRGINPNEEVKKTTSSCFKTIHQTTDRRNCFQKIIRIKICEGKKITKIVFLWHEGRFFRAKVESCSSKTLARKFSTQFFFGTTF